ncbi:MAG: cyclic beta 1-2 glucan synthetase [Planctomycetia bacterium]|nr:cyclic beta 1-2 glucan synthetase [Planctomycetia bacterium]
MLRLALIENLRRVAARIAAGRFDRDLAEDWAARMIKVAETNPSDLILVLADMARSSPPLSGAFLAELTRHFQAQSSNFAVAGTWLEQRCSEQGLTIEQLVRAEGQSQAADQISIGNSINSLRFLGLTDWREFTESHSVVEQALFDDPGCVYARMDFATRDRYRHEIEKISKRSRQSEYDVARRAIQLAEAAALHGQEERAAHVGFYLIDRGRAALDQATGVRPTLRDEFNELGRRYPLFLYLVSVAAITGAGTAAWWLAEARSGTSNVVLSLLVIAAVITAAQLAIGVVNWLAMLFVGPRMLPRMDFQEGIPDEERAIVVVPTMLARPEGIEGLLEDLEVRYLANADDNLHFGLLTDFEDAPKEHMPADDELVRLATEGVERLNKKYDERRSDIFFLFHRPRRWNEQEQVWMGYERKRGKLAELNDLLRGSTGRFSQIVGDTRRLTEVRYVVTLDTDTQLPRDSAREMVAAMAHTLNRPVIDSQLRRVVEGYGIMQPRVGVSLPSARRSWFVRLFAGDVGVDPYTRVVSDVYQDLFGEGSFVGKGIYDVDAFEQTCSGFPENKILSHDLLESAYARSGLLSDVELYEDFPSRYMADVSRRHRWMRGDWQIAAWTLPRVPDRAGKLIRNTISILSKWKIFDNLRRSATAIGGTALLLGSWAHGSTSAWIAATLTLLSVGLVPLLSTLRELTRKQAEIPLRAHLLASLSAAATHAAHALFTILFLAYDAYIGLDAIARTIARVAWTRRNLLEWKTSSDAQRGPCTDLVGFYRTMWFGPTIALFAGAYLFLFSSAALPVALPFLILWMCSPAVAWWLSRPLAPPQVRLSNSQQEFLGAVARRTWRYFETFAAKEENWLPPDNYQEHPAPQVASRTSPTNLGMGLLADLAAYDLGYCSAGRLLERTQRTLGTMDRMERYRGHFYNWYDTRSLAPLRPLYVSTVDSGNLAGNLLVLRMGLLEQIDAPLVAPRFLSGLRDTLRVALETAHERHRADAAAGLPSSAVVVLRMLERLVGELTPREFSPKSAGVFFDRLATLVAEVSAASTDDAELSAWVGAFAHDCADHRADLRRLTPWTSLNRPALPLRQTALAVPIAQFEKIQAELDAVATLSGVAALRSSVLPLLDDLLKDDPAKSCSDPEACAAIAAWGTQLRTAVDGAARFASDRTEKLSTAARQCRSLAEMDFSFLFDEKHSLFIIGYDVGERRPDKSFYDLLASEARLASFVCIAQGKLSQEHWFALSRILTTTGGGSALLSWSGSMFEYLMPLLVMPTYESTLLDQTYRAVVRRQIDYGRQRGVPWGISESGFNTVDVHLTYQYRAFGVPGLGLKRGLAEDLVVAPYASALALMVAPDAACRNMQRLADDGHQGAYGLYEAIDYTPSRLPRGASRVAVRQFMAHHQGMSLLAIDYVLADRPMQRRFKADPMLLATDLLLQERVPKAAAAIFPHAAEADATRIETVAEPGAMRIYTDPSGPTPEINLLSNGRYHLMITAAGGGYSRWGDLAVTRWREDATRDCWGSFCYLRDKESGVFWSTAFHPTQKPSKQYEAIFTQARAEFRRRDEGIETYTEISVSPEDDVELRRISITNRSDTPRTIEVTSYAEVVLAAPAHDLAHPAFSNLFVQTELVRNRQAILCTRRARSAEEVPPWMVHLMTVQGTTVGEASFETDRMRFVGRSRSLSSPAAMDSGAILSDSEGAVLDPSVSIRRVLLIAPNETVRVDFVTGVAVSRDAAAVIMDKYHDSRLSDRVFELAWTHSSILLRQLNATEAEAQVYTRSAGSLIYASSLRRAKPALIGSNRRGQSGLWGYGISGDLPIVLVRIRDQANMELVRQAVQAHAYWRLKGLKIDLVVWNEDDSVYRQTLQDAIHDLIVSSPEGVMFDKPGGIFIRRGEQISEEDRTLLLTVARMVLFDDAGTFAEQIERRGRSDLFPSPFKPVRRPAAPRLSTAEHVRSDLVFFNGLGGFTSDGREYVTILNAERTTPAPWVNVLANPYFGTVVSESGSAYTWIENSHEFRLTPWYDDPVTDVCGEAFYLRDEQSGRFWSPTPLPARGKEPYTTRHGFGYSIFEHTEDDIATELCMFVATDAPVKFIKLKIANRSGRPRSLSVTGYWEWVLGELRDKTLMHVVTELDSATGALFARNAYSTEFSERVAFVDCSETMRSVTADRMEFLGRNGTPANPAALRRVRLSGRVGPGLDPCAAMQVQWELEDGHEKEIVFILGAANAEADARQLIDRFRGVGNAQRALEAVWRYWGRTLGTVYLETPDPAVNFLANGWLVYQTLACRMWARTGFYQSGGAFGFRDQLQDAMALQYAEPGILRAHLLRAAAHQFREGDVQHWWHPPAGRGVRTHFSDDYLWLPVAACRYVAGTGDTGVLEERVPFLTARTLRLEEEAFYDLPQVSDDVDTLYEHCVRAIENGLRFGEHGLPLMGCGDWNDGMNLVGAEGKGESVWLGFFLFDVLTQFAELARSRSDIARADRYDLEAGRLRGNIEAHGWDGDWYRRAYFDDGEPLGSATNIDCQIDSLSQSWAVLSGAGILERAHKGMENVERRLVRRDSRLIQLLDPPFDKSALNPGYIKGYVPGVRENGGQYTHAAIWTVMAFAKMGEAERAWELFSMINPIAHGSSAKEISTYRVEPYVVAADVYSVAPHTGRGGWTWYTGSAGWMYRLITESLVGLRLEVDRLRFEPRLPASWPAFKIHYRYRETVYHITIAGGGDGATVKQLTVDGVDQAELAVRLVDDRRDHAVQVTLG